MRSSWPVCFRATVISKAAFRPNYLCAPALVIAYSLAGTIDFDFETEALGIDAEGNSIYLKDIWPDDEEVTLLLEKSRTKEVFDRAAVGLFDGDERWQALG